MMTREQVKAKAERAAQIKRKSEQLQSDAKTLIETSRDLLGDSARLRQDLENSRNKRKRRD